MRRAWVVGALLTLPPRGYAGAAQARRSAKWGCGAVDRASRWREARTWYADASPSEQHVVMLVGAALVVIALIAIVLVALAVFGVNPDGTL